MEFISGEYLLMSPWQDELIWQIYSYFYHHFVDETDVMNSWFKNNMSHEGMNEFLFDVTRNKYER